MVHIVEESMKKCSMHIIFQGRTSPFASLPASPPTTITLTTWVRSCMLITHRIIHNEGIDGPKKEALVQAVT